MSTDPHHAPRLRVLVLGGGVAGVECVLGLHDLAAERVEITMLSESDALHYRPLAIGEPFGGARAQRYPLADLAAATGARVVHGRAEQVDAVAHAVQTLDGERLEYDVLIVALGAVPYLPYDRALMLDVARPDLLEHVQAGVRSGEVRRLAVVLPSGPHWTLPGYELALMLARDAVPADFELTLITPEEAPMQDFGPVPSAAVAAELAQTQIRLLLGSEVTLVHGQPTTVAVSPSGERFDVDLVVALPALGAPATHGLPTTATGFLPVDGHGRMRKVPDVYAAGDCIDFPLKQGGLASQQADVVVEHVAARAGAALKPRALRPVLRAQMLTGAGTLWLRRDLSLSDDAGEVAGHALWWPPDKIAGRWLAPYVAAIEDGRAGVPHPPAHGRTVPPAAAGDAVPVPRDLDLLGDPGSGSDA